MTKFTLPPLPYAYDALEPVISKQTMEFHHDKHLKAYIDNVNKLVVGSDLEGRELKDIVKLSKDALFNNAAQSWNHIFFFEGLTSEGSDAPEGVLLDAIETYFTSFSEFKARFNKAAMAQFGSGWAWLCMARDSSLVIISTSNAQTPMNLNLTALLTVDVWEHAYYLDYRNIRAEYLENIWRKINWKVVQQRYEAAM